MAATTTSDLDRTVSATVTALYRGRGLSREDLREAIGVSYGTIVSRLQGRTAWTAYEVYTLAAFFNVRIGDLTEGLGGMFDGGREAPRRNVRSLPRRDSNTQPAGYRPLCLVQAA